MNKQISLLAMLFFLFVSLSYPQNVNQLKNRLQSKLDELQIKYKFPGATFALVLKDNSFIRLATGENDITAKSKMTIDDLMCGGSTGKIFVAPILLQLVNEKKIGLDDKALKYFEKDEWFKDLPNYDKITIRHLLNHTTGIPEYIIKETFGKDIVQNPDKVWKPEELLSYVAKMKPLFPAGEGWAYADANYIVLGIILERVCNNTYYNELNERILKPMKLTRTVPQESRKVHGVAQGYSGDSPYLVAPATVIKNGEFFVNPQFEWTGGGLFTNPIDLAVWAKYLWKGNFLPKELNDQMKQPVSFRTGKPDKEGYGFGLMKFSDTGLGDLYTHGGIMFGYLTEVFYIEKYDMAVAMQINSDPFCGFFRASLQQIVVSELIPYIAQYLSSK